MYRIIVFLFTSIATGLAAAFIILLVKPDLFQADSLIQYPPIANYLPQQAGPVSYAKAVNQAAPSVVNVYATKITRRKPHPLFDDTFFQHLFGDRISTPRYQRKNSLGSGVLVSRQGYILTNHHVINQANEIRVVLRDGRQLPARTIGTDPETDLAILKVADENLPVATLGNSQQLRVGDVVLAIGNPFGVGQTVTFGIVSATGRSQLGISDFENFIQTDAAINPGNSGGALVNALGEVIGINTAIFSESGGSHGIGFAIPMQLAHGVMQQIIEQGRVIRGWIGLTGQTLTPALAESLNTRQQQGILISATLPDGPADRAGIRPGDLLTALDNQPIMDIMEMLHWVASKKPGETLTLTVERRGDQQRVRVIIAERPGDA